MAKAPLPLSYGQNQTALLFSDASVPIVSLDFSFKAGSAFDPKGKEGLSAITAAMLTESVEGYDALSYKKALESHAIQLSYNVTRDDVVGRLQFLKTQKEDAIRLARLSFLHPAFTKEDLTRIKRQQSSYFDYKDQTPRILAQDLWWETAFAGHPYGHPIEGTRETVARFTPKDVQMFFKNCVTRRQFTVGIAGDIAPAEATALLNQLFGDLPDTAGCAQVVPLTLQKGQKVHQARKVPQNVAFFGHASIRRTDPDFYAMMIVDYTLGSGSFSSRLMDEIREKRGLTYGIGTMLSDMGAGPLILGQVSAAADKMHQALSLTQTIWQDVEDKGITPEELNDAKLYLNGSFPLQQDSTKKLSALMLYMQQQNLPLDYLDKRSALINAVTLEQANSVAGRVLKSKNLIIAEVGPHANSQSRAH
ncbi:MAG: M16 family metallopeptidase [Alphaproteobacteria bacterium]